MTAASPLSFASSAPSDPHPLYPHLLGFPLQMALLTDPHAPFPAMGLVHVRNAVEAPAAVPLGVPLDVEVGMEPPQPHRRGRTVDLVARVSADGEEVWRSVSTYLRAESRPGDTPGAGEETGPATEEEQPFTGPPAVWRLPAACGRGTE